MTKLSRGAAQERGMGSPTVRTLKHLRDNGYVAEVVEKWNAFARIRQDLFGIIDVVAVKPGTVGVLGVQTTSYSNVSARIKKSMANKVLPVWVRAGNRFVVHGWKKGVRGDSALRSVEFTYDASNEALQANHTSGREGRKEKVPD